MKKGVDYIGVGVGAVIVNDQGKMFLALRGQKARNERGMWEFPGGGVEFSETLEEALLREMKEEYGIEIEILELLDICSHIIPDEKQHWVSPTYIAKITNGEPCIAEEGKCEKIGWFTFAEMETMPLSLITRHNLESVKKKYPNGIII